MEYVIVIAPRVLTQTINSESKRIIKEVYGKDTKGVYYRIKTAQHQKNPRRVFTKGNGEILEFNSKPHITLVQDLDLPMEKVRDFIRDIEDVVKNQKSFTLNLKGFGDYNQGFTFYIEFKKNREVGLLFERILEASRPYLAQEKYDRIRNRIFVPHATLLYDDVDPKKVKTAESRINKDLFNRKIKVSAIELWTFGGDKQGIIHIFPLA